MPATRKLRAPSYRLHKPTGKAVVTLNGRDFYLGSYGSDESRAEYDRLIAEWLANRRRLPGVGQAHALSVNELLLMYWKHAEAYYRKNGRPTQTLYTIKSACRPLKRLYGHTPAADFGPKRLKAVRQAIVDSKKCRKTVNAHVAWVRRVFRWGTAEELVPPSVSHALAAVEGLKKGRSPAPETGPVRPVPDVFVQAVCPFVSPEVWCMIQIQRLTGMRPAEVTLMRGVDIDMSGKVWTYRPAEHKVEHHDLPREIRIGPKAQAIIRPWLTTNTSAYLFSPRQAEARRSQARRATRKTPMTPSQVRRRPKKNRKRPPAERYTTDSYRRAIARACDRVDAKAKEQRGLAPDSERAVPSWTPNQLRHNFGTRLRREYGLEVARILLGHQSAVTSEIYAEADAKTAEAVISKVG